MGGCDQARGNQARLAACLELHFASAVNGARYRRVAHRPLTKNSALVATRMRRLFRVALVGLLLGPVWSGAAVIEEVIDVSVTASTIYGQSVTQNIPVTIWRDDSREKAPFLVLNHGRPATSTAIAGMGRQRYSQNAQYFVAKGFVVLIPTRLGYGPSGGGTDVEYSGPCQSRSYTHVFRAAADQTLSVLRHAKTLAYIDSTRGILVGQSVGGAVTLALASLNVDGVVAAVNFAGGSGGNPETSPERPCRPDLLEKTFSEYGRTAKVPTLWLYSENDRYWGAQLPRKWFDAFVASGGRATFQQLPAFKADGHPSFTANADAWKPAVEAFLKSSGF